MVDNKTGIYIFLLYFWAFVFAVIAFNFSSGQRIFSGSISVALLALAIYFSINPDKLALRSYEDPDRHPF